MALQTQVTMQESILQERIKQHEQRVLKAETILSDWEVMLTAQEERHEAKEDKLSQRLQQQEKELTDRMRAMGEQLEERQSERILEDGSDWEDHLHTKTDEYVASILERLRAQERTQLAEYRDSLHELATQRELKAKAWMAIATTQALDGLSEKLRRFQTEQQERIEEFFTVQQQNLQQDLDEFQYHAQETLHAGIFGADHPNPRARHARPPSRTIPVETEIQNNESPPSHNATPHPAASVTGTTEVSPQKQTRWKHVDMEAIRLGRHSNAQPEQAQARAPLPQREHRVPSPAPQAGGEDVETAENYIARLRKTATPMQLRGQQRQAVVTWYTSFVDFLKTYRVPIKKFDEFQVHKLDDPAEILYPQSLVGDPHMYDPRYSAAIYARLEEDQVLDPDNKIYMGLLQSYNSTRDGYSVLKSILAATLLADLRNISVLSTPPAAPPGTDPFVYAASLKEFFSHQAPLERHYHLKEQAMMHLQAMQQQPKYTAAATQMLHDLEQVKLDPPQELPARYRLSQLPSITGGYGYTSRRPDIRTYNSDIECHTIPHIGPP